MLIYVCDRKYNMQENAEPRLENITGFYPKDFVTDSANTYIRM